MDPRPPLLRSRADRIIAGVCGGLANHLGVPVHVVRLAMVVAALLGGAGIGFYLFLFLSIPEEDNPDEAPPLKRVFTAPREGPATRAPASAEEASPPRGAPRSPGSRRRFPLTEVLLGGSLLITGVSLLLVQIGIDLNLHVIIPGLAVIVGVGLTWWLLVDSGSQQHRLPRTLGALALVALGVIMFFVTAREPTVLSIIGAALAVLAGVALAIAPWLVRLNRELVSERAAREREAERAEIAAHLHDSVLQTLALIQQRSEPGTEVARLARGQERELREWLFRTADGDGHHPRNTAATELTQHAAALEAAQPVRFEVISVGEHVVAPDEIIAAAREAMNNAAQHAGGEVTVYLEMTAESVSIKVTDRGPGFNPEAVDSSRFGVRESIVGRMERAGGRARIVPGPGGRGTSVRLEQQRSAVRDGVPHGVGSEEKSDHDR